MVFYFNRTCAHIANMAWDEGTAMLRSALFGGSRRSAVGDTIKLVVNTAKPDLIRYGTNAEDLLTSVCFPLSRTIYKCSCVAQQVLCDALKEYNTDDIIRKMCDAKDLVFDYCIPQSTALTVSDVGTVLLIAAVVGSVPILAICTNRSSKRPAPLPVIIPLPDAPANAQFRHVEEMPR